MKILSLSIPLCRATSLALLLAAVPFRAQDTMGQTARPVDGSRIHYLTAGQPDTAAILPPPPLPGSAEQAADMAEVVAVYHACTTNEAAAAFSEKKFSSFNFAPAIGSFFQPGKLPKTEAFLERAQAEAA